MQELNRSIASVAAAALLAALLCTTAHAVTVLSASDATADGEALSAGGEIGAGGEITTGASGAAALSVGELWVECGASTRLRVESDGSLSVAAGLVRVVDLAEAGAQTRLSTPHAKLRLRGSDTEILVDPERTEVCERRRVIEVGLLGAPATEEWRRAEPGSCATAAAGSLTTAPIGAARVTPSGARVDVAIVSHFSPTDVADPPPPSLDLFPLDPDKRTYLPCDDPGSCGGLPNVLVQPAAVTPEPTPRPIPPPDFGFGTGPADQPGGEGPTEF